MAAPSVTPDILRKDNDDPEREPSLSGYIRKHIKMIINKHRIIDKHVLYLHLYSFFPAINRWQIHHRIVLEIMMSRSPVDYNPLQQGPLLNCN